MSVELALLVATWALFGVGYVVRRSRLLRDPKAGRLGAVPELISGAHDAQEREARREERRCALTRADDPPMPVEPAPVGPVEAPQLQLSLSGDRELHALKICPGCATSTPLSDTRCSSCRHRFSDSVPDYVVGYAQKLGRTHRHEGVVSTTWVIRMQDGALFVGTFASSGRCLVFDKESGISCDQAQARAIRDALLIYKQRRRLCRQEAALAARWLDNLEDAP